MKKIFNLKYKFQVSILSLIYSLLLLFGTSYMYVGNSNLIKDNIIVSLIIFIIIFFIFRILILLLFKFIDNKKIKESNKKTKFRNLYDKYPFIISIIIILILWLPYIISFYPVILSPDPSFQIRQYFKIPNKYSDYSIMIDPNVTITNHHPVVHTLILGTLLKIGNIMGNDNFGLFMYSIIQILILSSTLAYTIKYMKKINTPYKYRLIALLIYSLVPMYPMYAMSAVKDVIFSSLITLYIILIYHIVKNKDLTLKFKNIISIFILLTLIILFRNNGFHIVLLSFPLTFLLNKKNLKKLVLIFILFLTFNFSYNNIILKYFKVTPSSIREVLSIPFQQTARYVKYKDVSSEEYEIYDKVLDMSTLSSRYDPEISDPVKNKYNKYATSNDLKKYFKYWFKDLLKAPNIYIDATINNTYGYFYPFKTNWYIYYKYDTKIKHNGFNYHYNNLENSRNLLSGFGVIFPFIPIIGLISNIGFNTWILFFLTTYLIYKKRYRYIAFLIPSFIVLLVCVASPVNTYFRYAMPYIFAMPIIIALFNDCTKEEFYE